MPTTSTSDTRIDAVRAAACRNAVVPAWLCMASLGRPVVPLEPNSSARSRGSRAPAPGAGAASSCASSSRGQTVASRPASASVTAGSDSASAITTRGRVAANCRASSGAVSAGLVFATTAPEASAP